MQSLHGLRKCILCAPLTSKPPFLKLCVHRNLSTTTPLTQSVTPHDPHLRGGSAGTSAEAVPLLEIDQKTLEESQAARLLKENLGLAKQLPKRMKHAHIHSLAERARFLSHPDYISQKDLLERATAAKDLADSIQNYQKAKAHLRVKQRTGYRTMKYVHVPNAEGTAYRDPTLNFGGGKNKVAGQLYPRLDPRLEAFYSKEFDKKYCFKEEDVTETVARGHGPGGQAVNMRAQTCTLLHRPSSIIVKVSKYPSLWQNRKIARGLLHRKVEAFLLGEDSRDARLTREAWRQRQFALTTQKLASELAVEKEQRRWWKLLAFHAGSKDAAAGVPSPLKSIDSNQSRRRRQLELAVIKEADAEAALSAEVISPLFYARKLSELLRSLAQSSTTSVRDGEGRDSDGCTSAARESPSSPSLQLIDSLLGNFTETSGKGRLPATSTASTGTSLVNLDCLKTDLASHWWTLLELSWKELPEAQRLIDETIASLSGEARALLARRIARLRETRGLGSHRTTPFRQMSADGEPIPTSQEDRLSEAEEEQNQQPCPRLSLLPLWFSFLFPCPIVSVSCRGSLESDKDSHSNGFIDTVVLHEHGQGKNLGERHPIQLPCQLISFCVPLKLATRVCREIEAASTAELQQQVDVEPEGEVTGNGRGIEANAVESAEPGDTEESSVCEVESCISEDWNSAPSTISEAGFAGGGDPTAQIGSPHAPAHIESLGDPQPEVAQSLASRGTDNADATEHAMKCSQPLDELHGMMTESLLEEAEVDDAEQEAEAEENVELGTVEATSVVSKSQEKLLQTETLLQELGKTAMEDELRKCCSSEVVRHSVESLIPMFLELFGLRLVRKEIAASGTGSAADVVRPAQSGAVGSRPIPTAAAVANPSQQPVKKKKKIVVLRSGKSKSKPGTPSAPAGMAKPDPAKSEGDDTASKEEHFSADTEAGTGTEGPKVEDALRTLANAQSEGSDGNDFPTPLKVEREGLRWVELRHRLLQPEAGGRGTPPLPLPGMLGSKKDLLPNPLAVAAFAHVLCCLESLKLVDELHAIILFLRDAMPLQPLPQPISSSTQGGLPAFPAPVARCILKAFAMLRKA
jgi:hypothetical protein